VREGVFPSLPSYDLSHFRKVTRAGHKITDGIHANMLKAWK